MVKAILVLDEMPDVCGNCFLFDVNNDTDMREICVPKYWHTNKDEKPDWCPLKELPKKRNTVSFGKLGEEAEHNGISTQQQAGYNSGWNDCLKEIMGE